MAKMKTISVTVVTGSVVSKSLAAVHLFRIGSQPERLFIFLLSLRLGPRFLAQLCSLTDGYVGYLLID